MFIFTLLARRSECDVVIARNVFARRRGNENETPVEVFFDDFKVVHKKSPVVQVDDYYPFGLTFNSYQRENSVVNKFKFQSQEHIDDLNLGWDSFKWRNYMPDIGRFFNVDPLASKYVYNSPYAFSENHVTSHVELEGLEKVKFMAALFKPHERGDVKVVENTIIDNSKNVKNENLGQVTEYSSEAALVTNVDLGKGSHTQVDQIDPPAGIDNVVDFIRGQEFDHDFKMEKTETGSTITGQIEGTSFTINVGVTSDKLIFDSSISGGDSDKGFVIKVGGISITFAAGGRDSDSPVQTRAVIPYSMDKEGNVDIDASYYLQATKNDQNTDTNEKKQTSGNR